MSGWSDASAGRAAWPQRLHGPKRRGCLGSCAERDPGQRQPDGRRATPADAADQVDSDRCRDRADEGEPDVLLEAGKIEPGDAEGDREGGSAEQMETR